jgi:hypothetical protein
MHPEVSDKQLEDNLSSILNQPPVVSQQPTVAPTSQVIHQEKSRQPEIVAHSEEPRISQTTKEAVVSTSKQTAEVPQV